jgi:hypothetical protein
MSEMLGLGNSSSSRATASVMRTTSAMVGSTTSSSRSVSTSSQASSFRRALRARGACPPEDCGGTWGYADLKETLADPVHQDHDHMLDWLGLERAAEFDPAACDLAEINEVLEITVAARS